MMDMPDLRTAGKSLLADALCDARDYTVSLLDVWAGWSDDGDGSDDGPSPRNVPCLDIVNPPLWELGHVAWFMEYWCRRYRGSEQPPGPSILADADRWYDSRHVPHDSRWRLDLPGWDATRRYLDDTLTATAPCPVGRSGTGAAGDTPDGA